MTPTEAKETLGLDPNQEHDEKTVSRAFRLVAARTHPDVTQDPSLHEIFGKAQQAKAVLTGKIEGSASEIERKALSILKAQSIAILSQFIQQVDSLAEQHGGFEYVDGKIQSFDWAQQVATDMSNALAKMRTTLANQKREHRVILRTRDSLVKKAAQSKRPPVFIEETINHLSMEADRLEEKITKSKGEVDVLTKAYELAKNCDSIILDEFSPKPQWSNISISNVTNFFTTSS